MFLASAGSPTAACRGFLYRHHTPIRLKLALPIAVFTLPLLTSACLSGGIGRTTRVPESEPNDSREQALQIAIPGATTGVVGKDGDSVDWVRIDVPRDAIIVAELRNLSSGDRSTQGRDLDRFVIESDGTTIARSPESRLEPGFNSAQTLQVRAGQVLWVAIRPRSQKDTLHSATYTLLVKEQRN